MQRCGRASSIQDAASHGAVNHRVLLLLLLSIGGLFFYLFLGQETGFRVTSMSDEWVCPCSQPTRFAFVEFATYEGANNSLVFNGVTFKDRPLKCVLNAEVTRIFLEKPRRKFCSIRLL